MFALSLYQFHLRLSLPEYLVGANARGAIPSKKEHKSMSIIKSHHIILYGGNDTYKIILRPLSDKYLPYLYKWNSDPEVLYWTEGEDVESYPPEVIHQIYGGISQNNLCFLVEVNGKIIGECWLQRMNLLNVKKCMPIVPM